MAKKKKEVVVQRREVAVHTTFRLAYIENVQRLVMALAFCGYYPQVKQDGGIYTVEVYTTNI